ncbi:MAG: type VI secretion system domain-containing protein [Reinekea sp.]
MFRHDAASRKSGRLQAAKFIALQKIHRFLQRLPKLSELHFKGGQPFISRQTLDWVSDQGKTASVNASDWQTLHQQARQMAQEQGLTETLSMLNEALGNASELREQIYWQWLCADVMHQHGLSAMAKQQCQALLEQLNTVSLSQWEPSLIQQLKHIAGTE